MELVLTTNPGLEDIVSREIKEKIGILDEVTERFFGLNGYVRVIFEEPGLYYKFFYLRSIHHIIEILDSFSVYNSKEIRDILNRLDSIDLGFLSKDNSFRVTSLRLGKHDFSSVYLSKVSGGNIDRRTDACVDLENFDYDFRVDLIEDRCFIGLQKTKYSLSKRHAKVYNPRGALKQNVAYALLKITGIYDYSQKRLLDPFCGSGSILIEARELYTNLELHGMDVDKSKCQGTLNNLASCGFDTVNIKRGNSRSLSDYFCKRSVDCIVTNPPYGISVSPNINYWKFYHEYLREAYNVLNYPGRISLLVVRDDTFEKALSDLGGFEIKTKKRIETCGIYPYIYVLDKN